MRMKILTAAVVGFAVGSTGTVEFVPQSLSAPLGLELGFSEAHAQHGQSRRVARRTSRRTTTRVNYRQSVSGCSPYNAYYNCGGVYYQPVVQDGTTVYVVVNP